jgi:CDP-diacylglycerol--glycerol-3-phosphate 3-phosphatidyltransferase/cardiolipin synthase
MTPSESRYRLRDLLLPPAWLSLLRVPLAVCFVALVNHPLAAFAVLVAAGASDLLDGWLARRYHLVTATGAALDPITDKVFVLTVAVALVASRHLAPSSVLLLSTRELGEIVLMVWLAAHRAPHVTEPAANGPGKLATVVQFVTVGWMLFRAPWLNVWLVTTAIAGALAAFSYWRRALQASAVRPLSATRRTPD